jgi:hypothetical protein
MGKVSIKKNIKPKKVTIKKTIKPKKKEIKDQTQTQNVIVNVNETITKKKRGRPSKRSKIEKTAIKPASQQPITQSYIQPIFKQSAPQQPSSLASSILASQNIPKVIKEEVKEESALRKALTEQNLSTAEDPIEKSNDLERVKVERTRKPKIEVIKEPVRSALLSQLITEEGDDTEEIQQLIRLSKPPITTFTPIDDNELISIKTKRKEPKINPLVNFSPSIEPPLLSQENKQPDLLSAIEEIPEIQQEAPVLIEEGEDQQIAPVNNDFEEEEEIPLTTPKETTILEPPKKVKALISSQAEEPFTEIKVVDESSNETTTTNTEKPGLQEFTTRIKAFPTNATLIAYLKKNSITMPKEKNRDGYEKRLIEAFKDGKIDLVNP